MSIVEGKSGTGTPFRPGLFESSPEGQPRLLTSSCTSCGRSFFPSRADCPHCGVNGQIVEAAIVGIGTIYASTVVHVPSPAGLKPPYAYGFVQLDAAPLRVAALFTMTDPARLGPGSRVEMVLDTLRKDKEGNELIAYKFHPVVMGNAS